MIASLGGGTLWDNGKEPLQWYSVIVALRNELIHYKGQFLGKDEAPSKKIKDLLMKFQDPKQSNIHRSRCIKLGG